MEAVGVAFLVIAILAVFGGLGYFAFVRWRANKLGLPPPTVASFNPFGPSEYGAQPASGGIGGWFSKLKGRNSRTAAGAYEGAAGVAADRGGRRGGGAALDPDEAWDTRVGNEVYGYEDQELGLHPQHGGSAYRMNLPDEDRNAAAAGRPGSPPTTRNPFGDDNAYEQPRGRGRSRDGGLNPFDDAAAAEPSTLRGLSPRPINTAVSPGAKGGNPNDPSSGDSPTGRRSIFRENV
ncbi:hypothetical protein PspLS_02731 [Pyricularia sp. CBS 133598]|nr:hypothetical protein PspLS_02731 [Pyricularia sp. CBS 133598]